MKKAKKKRPECGIVTGLRQALAYAQGEDAGCVVHRVCKSDGRPTQVRGGGVVGRRPTTPRQPWT